jgi:hypothetical protein
VTLYDIDQIFAAIDGANEKIRANVAAALYAIAHSSLKEI